MIPIVLWSFEPVSYLSRPLSGCLARPPVLLGGPKVLKGTWRQREGICKQRR